MREIQTDTQTDRQRTVRKGTGCALTEAVGQFADQHYLNTMHLNVLHKKDTLTKKETKPDFVRIGGKHIQYDWKKCKNPRRINNFY